MLNFRNIISGFNNIYIQTHDNPDADAIASAYGLQRLLEYFGKQAKIIYHGIEISKPNLLKMVDEYKIKLFPMGKEFGIDENSLLIIVDGQYGAGNVRKLLVKNVISIDHHLEETSPNYLYCDIQPRIGACTTIIFNYLMYYGMKIDTALATILYFGIFLDTDSFTGKMTTLDDDAKRFLEKIYDKRIIDQLRLSSLTFDDIKVCAEGMQNMERYKCIIFSRIATCDSNLLGHISDLLSEIDGVDIVVIYSPHKDGFKISVRSYHNYITAKEIVEELTENIGSGGGHHNKAGGFIWKERFNAFYTSISFDIFLRTKVIDYYRDLRFMEVGKDNPYDLYGKNSFFKAKKRPFYLRYLDINEYFDEDVSIKTLEGILTASCNDKLMIGVRNEIYPIAADTFALRYKMIEDKGIDCISERFLDDYGITLQSEAKVHRITKENIKDCKVCLTGDDTVVEAFKLPEKVNIRTSWGDMMGLKGDYLLVVGLDDYYICDKEIFALTYINE